MPTEPIIRIEDLHFTYPGDTEETLRGLSLDIAEGSFVAVLGHNGSGKSTLAKLLNAILLPSSGHIYVAGVDTADESRLLAVRGTVGLVFQNPDNQIVANVVEDDLWDFVSLTAGVLSDDPLFVIINSYTTGLSPSVLTYIAESIFTRRFGGRAESRELGLPVTATGLCLPCGAACRWETLER